VLIQEGAQDRRALSRPVAEALEVKAALARREGRVEPPAATWAPEAPRARAVAPTVEGAEPRNRVERPGRVARRERREWEASREAAAQPAPAAAAVAAVERAEP
jgi:hypothetical protein